MSINGTDSTNTALNLQAQQSVDQVDKHRHHHHHPSIRVDVKSTISVFNCA